MKLVFITRIVDKGDTRSGFIFDWIKAIAKRVERLYVICLEMGDLSGLPGNVAIGSMGKERGLTKLGEFFNYWRLLFEWVPKSNGVLVHMHPMYVLAGWLPIKVLGKKIAFWYTHKSVDMKLRTAHIFVNVIFTASKESFRLPSKKVRISGHGISIERFAGTKRPELVDNIFRIISVGRISPSKDYETLIKAVAQLPASSYQLHIYGDPALVEDKVYLDNLKTLVSKLDLNKTVKFHGGVGYDQVPQIYANADLFVNLSKTGSLDKTILEAAVSKTIVLTSNEAFYGPLRGISLSIITEPNDPDLLAQKIKSIAKMSSGERDQLINKLYEWVRKEHSLENLVGQVVQEFKK